MIFEPTQIDGLVALRLQRHDDERGSFSRLFSQDEFAEQGLPTVFAQQSLSVTCRAGTVRGMHFQRRPHAEVKFVRCVRWRDLRRSRRPEAMLLELSALAGVPPCSSGRSCARHPCWLRPRLPEFCRTIWKCCIKWMYHTALLQPLDFASTTPH